MRSLHPTRRNYRKSSQKQRRPGRPHRTLLQNTGFHLSPGAFELSFPIYFIMRPKELGDLLLCTESDTTEAT